MKLFFAYRLPGTEKPIFIEGEALKVSSLNTLPKTGFIFHSFDGEIIYLVPDFKIIDSEEFLVFLSDNSNQPIISKETYAEQFLEFKKTIDTYNFQKLVLSRIQKVNTSKNALDIFTELNKKYQDTYNYILSSSETGTWIGASPELLLRNNFNQIQTVSLAGTKAANSSVNWTTKEQTEQRIVSDFILNTLQKNNLKDISSSEVYTFQSGPVEHLRTDIQATISTSGQLINLLVDLHPTPATCGLPKKDAFDQIKHTEKYNRKFYTGFIGIIQDQQSWFFVNLRCMELFSDFALLYVGGGITKESILENEWLETCKKAETIGQVIS